MRLYLNANSEKNIAYTPDWMKISFFNENNEEASTLTLDVMGDIGYDKGLNCRVMGNLVPWIYDFQGEEVDYSDMNFEDAVKLYPESKIAELIRNAAEIVVGIYPGMNENMNVAELDEVSSDEGIFEWNDCDEIKSVEFKFDTELNL